MVGRARLAAMLVLGLASMLLLAPAASADLQGELEERGVDPSVQVLASCANTSGAAVCLFPTCLSLRGERLVVLPDPYVEAGDRQAGGFCAGLTTYCCGPTIP